MVKTSKAIEFLKTHDVTDNQGYNILIEDLWNIEVVDKPAFEDQHQKAHTITVQNMARPEVQAVIGFFMYQIQNVLFPVIRDLRQLETQVQHAGQIFKDELDEDDKEFVNTKSLCGNCGHPRHIKNSEVCPVCSVEQRLGKRRIQDCCDAYIPSTTK